MKKKCLLIILITISIVFIAQPAHAAVYNLQTDDRFASTSISAVAEPEYSFVLPENATIVYPEKEAVLGDFVVGDLLLAGDEWISIMIIPGAMVKTNDSKAAIDYSTYFDPPERLDSSNSGEAYNVTVVIDADESRIAAAGKYEASLLFRAISHPDNKVVWEGEAFVIVEMPGKAEETQEPGVTASPGVETPGATSSPIEAILTDEGIPKMLQYGLPAIALLLLLLLLLFRFTGIHIIYEVVKNTDGKYSIIWGYNSWKRRIYKVDENDSKITLVEGEIFKTESVETGQAIPPKEFEKGKKEAVFITVVKEGTIVEWKIKHRRKKVKPKDYK